ncbi:unnamed protein product, partial [Discosporangium mesarthrocarpum]
GAGAGAGAVAGVRTDQREFLQKTINNGVGQPIPPLKYIRSPHISTTMHPNGPVPATPPLFTHGGGTNVAGPVAAMPCPGAAGTSGGFGVVGGAGESAQTRPSTDSGAACTSPHAAAAAAAAAAAGVRAVAVAAAA